MKKGVYIYMHTEKQMVEKRRLNENGVIINVYVESRIPRSDQKIDRIKRINPVQYRSQSRVNKTQGYDRRAQLLAYSQELRHAEPRQIRKPPKNSRRKSKTKRRWGVVAERIKRLFSRLHGTKRQWRYEPIVREDCSDGGGKWSYGRTRKSHFCKKLVSLFKKISGAWKCKKKGATN